MQDCKFLACLAEAIALQLVPVSEGVLANPEDIPIRHIRMNKKIPNVALLRSYRKVFANKIRRVPIQSEHVKQFVGMGDNERASFP